MSKQDMKNLKEFCDSVIAKAKNGPRIVVLEKVTGTYKDLPQDGISAAKVLAKPQEYVLQGVYTSACKREWIYEDFNVKIKP